jgi:hypothetical protein
MPTARTTISMGRGATLFASGTADRRRAMIWATVTTLLSSLCTIRLADELPDRFSGKGVVPSSLTADPGFGTAVAVAAGHTVLLAMRLGMPISTTHALAGAINGGCSAVGRGDSLENTGEKLFRTAAAESNHRVAGHDARLSRISKNATGTRADNQHMFLRGRSNCQDGSGDEFGTHTAACGDIICVAGNGSHMSATIQRSGSGCQLRPGAEYGVLSVRRGHEFCSPTEAYAQDRSSVSDRIADYILRSSGTVCSVHCSWWNHQFSRRRRNHEPPQSPR